MKTHKLMKGNNIDLLKSLPDNSIDSVVTDPPYALTPSKGAKAGFMGKLWDAEVPSVDFWKEVYRVLKPGGHVLSFGGTRTYHRMVVNIEDAGFEIRDQIMWLYGSGFPKSHNIGKSVDKIEGNEREVVGDIIYADGSKSRKTSQSFQAGGNGDIIGDTVKTKGQSKYEGWGTALKPANEPICVARKPLSEKTIADNVIKWGTGGINVDGCRVGTTGGTERSGLSPYNEQGWRVGHTVVEKEEGRFPANIILDETAAELLDEQSGIVNQGHWPKGSTKGFGEFGGGSNSYEGVGPKDKTKSGASRFFYVAKVSKKERNMGLDGFEDKVFNVVNGGGLENSPNFAPKLYKNTHPTLKPINLMTYLCRLVTPKNGIVLDPFMGSGSTGIAARLEGFRFIGMEQDKSYFDIASARIEAYEEYRKLLK